MAEIPLGKDELEEIVSLVARDFLADLVIDNEIKDEDMEQWAHMSAGIAIFCIDRFMHYVTTALDGKSLNVAESNLITRP